MEVAQRTSREVALGHDKFAVPLWVRKAVGQRKPSVQKINRPHQSETAKPPTREPYYYYLLPPVEDNNKRVHWLRHSILAQDKGRLLGCLRRLPQLSRGR